jgi:hypothetical protein
MLSPLFFCCLDLISSNCLRLLTIVSVLSSSRTRVVNSASNQTISQLLGLTNRYNGPGQVEAHVIDPEIHKLRPTIRHTRVMRFEKACGVVERHTIDVRHAHHDLEGVTERTGPGHGDGTDEAEGAPDELTYREGSRSTHEDFVVELAVPVL